MKLISLLEQTYLQKAKRQVNDALALIKISGVDEVPVDSVIIDLAKKGIVIGKEELLDVLSDSDLIVDMDNNTIKFDNQTEEEKQEQDNEMKADNKVASLATKAINKRM